MKAQGYVVASAGALLEPFEFDRRELRYSSTPVATAQVVYPALSNIAWRK